MRNGFVYLRVTAVIFAVSGLIGLFLPDQYLDVLFGIEGSVGGRLWGRGFGAAALGLAVVLWVVDQTSTRQLRLGLIGAVVAYALTGLGDLVSVIQGDFEPVAWAFIAFHAAMAILGVIYLARSSPMPPEVAAQASQT